jgi:hypothetical protein
MVLPVRETTAVKMAMAERIQMLWARTLQQKCEKKIALPFKPEGSRQLVFLSQHVCDKCQTVHFTWKIQQQFDVYCTENSRMIFLMKKR